ncbi:MAG: response regulator transcription factor [Chloroflexi bacterium]|nr:response regulator transcription factor [Chloroflexota bacterium]
MAEGLSNAQIADVLTIEVSTVKKHVNNLFRKLNVSSREAAIRITQQPAG